MNTREHISIHKFRSNSTVYIWTSNHLLTRSLHTYMQVSGWQGFTTSVPRRWLHRTCPVSQHYFHNFVCMYVYVCMYVCMYRDRHFGSTEMTLSDLPSKSESVLMCMYVYVYVYVYVCVYVYVYVCIGIHHFGSTEMTPSDMLSQSTVFW